MSKTKMLAAREFIYDKNYDEARAILKTIDHPTARKWLVKLDKIDPPLATPTIQESANEAKPARRRHNPRLRLFLITVIVSLVAILAWVWVAKQPSLLTLAVASFISCVAAGLQQRPHKRQSRVRKNTRRRNPVSRFAAQPGEFDGIQFRSQLEIRFAAELKSRQIRYEYEKERLGKGRYQVDFYLPDLKCWVEVKGVFQARDNYVLQEVAESLRRRREKVFVYMPDKVFRVEPNGFVPLSHHELWNALGSNRIAQPMTMLRAN